MARNRFSILFIFKFIIIMSEELQKLAIRLEKIEGKLSADRKANHLHGKYQSEKLDEISKMLFIHINEEEADRKQITAMLKEIQKIQIERTQNIKDFTRERDALADRNEELKVEVMQLKSAFSDYKKKMKPWELKQELKRIPYLIFILTWFLMAYGYLKVILKFFIKKYIGLDI